MHGISRARVRQAHYLPKLTKWFSPAELLKMATHDNAELFALLGPRNPSSAPRYAPM
jgi:hypothetical protein